MSLNIATYWNYGKTFCSIEHQSNMGGEIHIHALSAIRKKDEYEIEKTTASDSFEKLSQQLPKNQHCFLNITGNQILIRLVAPTENAKKTIASAFPNIDTSEFYYQILETENQNIVAVCRRDFVNSIVESYRQHNIAIIGISFGFLAIQNMVSLIPDQEIPLAHYQLMKLKDEIISFEKTELKPGKKVYHIEGSTVQNEYLLALAGLFSYKSLPANTSSNLVVKNQELSKSFREQVFFRKGLMSAIGVLLFVLLINFLLFSSYYSELQNLTGQHQIELSQKKKYDAKLAEIKEKEKWVSNILENSNSKTSFYINRIVSILPESIALTELTYQPLERQIKTGDPIKLSENQIRISGENGDEESFSYWIKNMEEISWISEIKVADFSYKTASISEFTVNLSIEADEAAD